MTVHEQPLRAGLVGTGFWANITHAPAIATTSAVEFVAVWGRNADAAAKLATRFGIRAHTEFLAFLADVDLVAFSVPPDVQAELGIQAARAGKHLLLEKPIATTERAAQALALAVRDARVASVVFFTSRFQPEMRAWLNEVASRGPWTGGVAVWLGSALREASPFNTPWRHVKGGLWDLGPHVVSLLWASLGPVRSVTAASGAGDVTHLVLHHARGASSTATVTLNAPETAAVNELFLWGEAGRTAAPTESGQPIAALQVALTELAENARSGEHDHPCDVHFGHDVGLILANAQHQLDRLAR